MLCVFVCAQWHTVRMFVCAGTHQVLQLSCLGDSIAIDDDLWPSQRGQCYLALFVPERSMSLLDPDIYKHMRVQTYSKCVCINLKIQKKLKYLSNKYTTSWGCTDSLTQNFIHLPSFRVTGSIPACTRSDWQSIASPTSHFTYAVFMLFSCSLMWCWSDENSP